MAGSALSALAPAKLNLYLHVLARRPDGYHELDSLVAFAAEGDRLTVEPADRLDLRVTGPFAAALEAETDNLVLRAARRLADAGGVKPAARLTLHKALPVAAGLGGGSSDAAAALKLLARLWNLPAGQADLAAIAAGLGADVPVCLAARPAFLRGVGERLSPVERLPALGILLAHPGRALPTAQVFAAFRGPYRAADRFACDRLSAPALATVLSQRGNDLEATARALCPPIARLLADLAALPGALLARMSGSGACCFALFEAPGAAVGGAELLARARPELWLAATHLLDDQREFAD
ncbi:MAG: 4-(cytidine 5'-diphospho)-2-C-methyl-D-erythritol kinase [Alphaproteobacteria bacterium]|nr:4-(cytidine 5'-diphospho)-2-C-methyl-D-erythritol kinase [Alphaproteobacteria bacterium]